MCNKDATFSFLDKVFGTAHSPPRRGGVSATSKPKDPFRFVADGVVSSARLRRPAELTTITASRYRARASRPSAPRLWLRGIFLMAQPLLRLRPIGLALRALLCEEGNMTHSSSVQRATSSTFGCGSAAFCGYFERLTRSTAHSIAALIPAGSACPLPAIENAVP